MVKEVKAKYLASVDEDTGQQVNVQFIPPEPSGSDLGGITKEERNMIYSGAGSSETYGTYKGKILVSCGDSILAGWGWQEGTGFFQPLKEKYTNATWINKAESGANMAVTSSPNHTPIVTQIKSLTGTINGIMFDGGVNDANNGIPIGSVTDSYDSTFNESTFCGALESAIQFLMNNYPLTVKFFVLPYRFSKNDSSLLNVYDKSIEICEKWEMPYLDFRKCGQLAMTTTNKNKYTRNPNTGVADSVHRKEEWYRTFGSPIVDSEFQFLGIGYQKVETEPTVVKVSGVRLNVNTLELKVGDTQKLTETVLPTNATNNSVTWSVNNSNVSVLNGKVTANTVGTSIVTVKTTDGGYTATCSITVVAKEQTIKVTSVSLDKNTLSMNIGDTQKLVATVLPKTATNKAVTWKSNNTNATVVDGTITANKAGSAIITVTTVDGGYTDTCSVTIQEQVVEEHTKLESVTLDGNCYFDTELLADINTNTEQKINVKSGSTYIFGARDSNYKFGYSVTDNFYVVRGALTSSAKNLAYYENNWIVKQNKETFTFNEQSAQCDTIQELSMTSPMYIGNMSNNNAMAGNGMVGKFYYLKVYSGTTLISEIVPVRKSDRTLCLYDKTRNKYLYNKGSGMLSV